MILYALLISSLVCASLAQQQCTGQPNTIPIITSTPLLVSTTTNGALYQIDAVQPSQNVLHVYGSPYQMGYAHGTLMKSMIQDLYPKFNEWVDGQVEQYLNTLPQWLQDMIAKYGVEAALEATYLLTEDYIPKYFIEELQGMADAVGMNYMDVVRVHMFPELIKAQCTMVGAWGDAIKSTDGSLYQLRALDWSTNGPFQLYPTIIVYHPDNGHNFTIVTWAGFIGTITGFSSAGMGLSQKVWLHYNETSSRSGIPFHFLLRDILQFDLDMDSAISRIANAHRTCSIFIGLGDYTNTFKAIEYSYELVEVFDDKNYPAYKEHPLLDGVVYIDKHTQPSHNLCLGSLMQKYYGQLNADVMKQYVAALHQTGDMHIAIYDYTKRLMYVANASPYVDGNFIPAYDRPFVQVDLNDLFTTTL